jgi:serine/threonine protein kinase
LPEASPGTVLGKYRLGRCIGTGGMGVVYEAEDTVLNRRVAVKLLRAPLGGEQEAARFLREARSAARLNHPHVVTVHEADQTGGVYYLVMELVEGGSMQDALRQRGPLPWREATQVVADACRGLVAAHEAGLIHRDLKPSNLLRTRDGVVKLSDFGLARPDRRDGVPTSTLTAGTPEFMSPEQWRGDPLDARTDLYALGATYFNLLVARQPYPATSLVEIMYGHCSGAIPDPRADNPEIPAACAEVVRRALAKYPAERYGSAAEMLAALEAILAEGTPPRGSPQRLLPRRGKRGRWLAAGTVVVLAVTAALVWWFGPTSSGDSPVGQRGTDPPPEVKPGLIPWDRRFQEPITPEGLIVPVAGLSEVVAFSPDGRWLAVGRSGVTGVVLWDFRTGEQKECLPGWVIRKVGFSPDSAILGAVGAQRGELVVLRYELAAGRDLPLLSLNGWAGRISALQVGPRLLVGAIGSGPVRPEQDHYRLFLWDVEKDPNPVQDLPGMNQVSAVAFAPDGRTVAISGLDSKVRLYSWPQRQRGREFLTGPMVVGSLAFSPDGKTLVAAHARGLVFCDIASGETYTRPGNHYTLNQAFSPDGRLVALGQENAVSVRDGRAGRAVRELLFLKKDPVPGNYVTGLAFSADGEVLAAVAGRSGQLKLWDIRELYPKE